jgi:hypothetical protein
VLLEEGVPIARFMEVSGMSKASIYRLQKSALARGYDPKVDPHIKEEYVIDVPRAGRPKVTNEADEANIIHHVQETRAGRESTCAQLGHQFGVSAMTIDRILRAQKMGKRKPSWKPWLTDAMKAARYEFAKTYEHWKLEDWKNVIWSDGTSVVLGHRRGAIRGWRKSAEQYHKTCVPTRWKGVSEFMFWGCFSYDRKGPMHIWKKETANERREVNKELEAINQQLEPMARAEWEVTTALPRMHLRGRPGGRAPTWQFTAPNGAVTREKGTGIDW